MSTTLKGRGRGSILSTAEGQGSNRLRIEFRSNIPEADTSEFTLPTAGHLYDYVYFDAETQDLIDGVPEDWGTYTEIQNHEQIEGSSSNLGRLVRFFINDDGTIFVYAIWDKAIGHVFREGGQDYFRVTWQGSSGATVYDAAAADPVQYPLGSLNNVENADPGYSLQDTISYEHCSGSSSDCPSYHVLLDISRGFVDTDDRFWNEASS